MTKVVNVIFCLQAHVADGKVSADGILSALTPAYIPGLFSFSVVISVLDISPENEHSFRVVFTDPKGNITFDVSNPFTVQKRLDVLPAEYQGINFTMNFNNIDFKMSGLYKMSIWIDDTLLDEKEIYVKGKNE